ncbi:MAG: (d)CMP kinase [Bryobacterales bacterium]|nr:(d)CMP kinase [Bryobacterales bacterium]
MIRNPIVVAIDGPAGAGKSTIARKVAARLGFLYVDTGAMYRTVALWALRNGTELDDWHRLEQLALAADIRLEAESGRVFLNGEDVSEAIRTELVSDAASRVAAVPAVRRAMVAKQKVFAETSSIVMEGRDIGTVVFPEARVKIFMDADPTVRAQRRQQQLVENGRSAALHEVEGEMRRRDTRDRERAEAPLLQAPDAEYLDASGMAIEEVEEAVLKIVRERTSH